MALKRSRKPRQSASSHPGEAVGNGRSDWEFVVPPCDPIRSHVKQEGAGFNGGSGAGTFLPFRLLSDGGSSVKQKHLGEAPEQRRARRQQRRRL